MMGRASVLGLSVARGDRHQVRAGPVAEKTESDARGKAGDDLASGEIGVSRARRTLVSPTCS
jgi:hypothetical protein